MPQEEIEDLDRRLVELITQTMEDPNLRGRVCQVSSLTGHSQNTEEELERRFCSKILAPLQKRLENQQYLERRGKKGKKDKKKKQVVLGKVKVGEEGYYSLIFRENCPKQALGKLLWQIRWDPGEVPDRGELVLVIRLVWGEEPGSCVEFPFTPLVRNLRVQRDVRPIPPLDPETESPIFIDLEWVSCYKRDPLETWTVPGQVSEYAFFWEDHLYHSGFLKVNRGYTSKVRKKFLEKLEISQGTLEERHSRGRDFVADGARALLPVVEQIESQGKRPIFFYFGSEDGKILRLLFRDLLGDGAEDRFGYEDITARYSITNIGQMSLLHGLGVEFTHDFSSDMDVRALRLIYQVFSQAQTVQEAKNLLVGIQLQKMVLQSENPCRLEQYLHFFMKQPKTRRMLTRARELAQAFGQD